ncbi:MAG: SMC-Scp complex subunit ScpB [Pirellulaceae bacterium]|nr:SMC-Scp complex subunit ScpB [Pirellulaceae bacterium]
MTHDDQSEVDGFGSDSQNSDDAEPTTLSVDQLTNAFAQLIGQDSPAASADEDNAETESKTTKESNIEAIVAEDDDSNVSAEAILEAILFVGHPQNEPLTSRLMASYLRGVTPAEIDDLVLHLNQLYQEQDAPYQVVSDAAGYRLALRAEFEKTRERFYGRVREAKLSQLAVDLLAVVAYNQPISRQQIETLKGRPCGGALNQLVRRQLLAVERDPSAPKKITYKTTDRFLDLFRLESLDDLPSHDDFG